MIKNKKGGTAFLWIFGILMIFVGGLLYIGVDQGYQKLYEKVYPMMDADAQASAVKNNSIWNNVPIFIVLGGVLSIVAGTFWRNQDTGMY